MANNYAFVDAQNVNLSVQNQWRKLDWNKFRVYLSEHYHVTQAYLFIGYLEEQKELYEFLQQAWFTLIYKAVHTTKEGMTKGNVDAELVLQAMIDIWTYDKAVIVTWDGDFACLVKYLLEQKKLLKVIVPNIRQHSILLRDVAKDAITSLSALKMKLKFRGKRGEGREERRGKLRKVEEGRNIDERGGTLSKVVQNSPKLSKVVENSQTSWKMVQNRPTLRKIEEGRNVEERRSPLEKQKQTPSLTIKHSKLNIISNKPSLVAVASKAKQLLINYEKKEEKQSSKKEQSSPVPKKQYKSYSSRFVKKRNQERQRPSFLE